MGIKIESSRMGRPGRANYEIIFIFFEEILPGRGR